MHGQAPAAQVRVVDDVVVDQGGSVNELDDGRVERAAIAAVARQARGHEEDGRTDPLAAARTNVLPDLRDQIDVRLEMPLELAIDLVEVTAYRFENLRKIGRRFLYIFHSGSGRTLSRPEQAMEIRSGPFCQLARV